MDTRFIIHFVCFFPFSVGGGTAGSVLASRLTENPKWKVLVLEAGGDETEVSDVPVIAQYMQLGNLDWQFKTEPQPTACRAMKHWVSTADGPNILPNLVYH